MAIKISARTHKLLFALVMSGNTALITMAFVLYTHAKPHTEFNHQFVSQWLSAFIHVWPIVFLAIMLIAPVVNRILDFFFILHTK